MSHSLATKIKISETLKRRGIKPIVRWSAQGQIYSPEKLQRFRRALRQARPGKFKPCKVCGKIFRYYLSQNPRSHCSKPCHNASMRKPLEWRKVMHLKDFHLRRARKMKAGGSFTYLQWKTLCASSNFMCRSCGRSEPHIKLTADHMVAISQGGDNSILNIQPLCRSCNARKATQTRYFLPRLLLTAPKIALQHRSHDCGGISSPQLALHPGDYRFA